MTKRTKVSHGKDSASRTASSQTSTGSRKGRPLGERHLGLLIRMLGFHTCVCRKKTQEPLLKRGLTETTPNGSYSLTRDGKKFALAEIDRLKDKKGAVRVTTWGGISMGDVVFIVQDSKRISDTAL